MGRDMDSGRRPARTGEPVRDVILAWMDAFGIDGDNEAVDGLMRHIREVTLAAGPERRDGGRSEDESALPPDEIPPPMRRDPIYAEAVEVRHADGSLGSVAHPPFLGRVRVTPEFGRFLGEYSADLCGGSRCATGLFPRGDQSGSSRGDIPYLFRDAENLLGFHRTFRSDSDRAREHPNSRS